MHVAPAHLPTDRSTPKPQHTVYLWAITFAAAMGGLLFGYDWVVIGGARQFYEAYFHLTSEAMIGWANSCARVPSWQATRGSALGVNAFFLPRRYCLQSLRR